MLRQLKEIFEEELTASYSSDKKLQKCVSATDISSLRTKNIIKTSHLFQPASDLKTQRSRQTDEFLFCLKLKMIGIAGIFGNSELDTEKIETKDANQVLNLLTRKIKNFQKESNKRINEQITKNKMLQIKIIDLESLIKSLQSQQAHSQKQIEKSSKSFAVDLKKFQRKIQEAENQKQLTLAKLRSANQLADEQSKFIMQLQYKIAQLTKAKKGLETSVFQKEKLIAKSANDEKFAQIQHSQECEALKKSLMKKTEQVNKLNSEIKNLKQVIESKERKNQEMRISYNKLFHEKEESQSKLRSVSLQNTTLLAEGGRIKQEYEASKLKFSEKQEALSNSISQMEQALELKFNTLKKIREEVDQTKIKQHHIQTEVNWLVGEFKDLPEALQKKYDRQESLLREQYEIEKRTAILDLQQFYQNKLAKFQDLIYRLERQQKAL